MSSHRDKQFDSSRTIMRRGMTAWLRYFARTRMSPSPRRRVNGRLVPLRIRPQ